MIQSEDIQIKTISLQDAENIRKLSGQLGYSISLEDTQANIKQILALESHTALVAISNDKIVGWIHAFETRTIESLPFIELAGLVIDENARGKGIGKILVEKIKQWCMKRNISSLRVRSNVIRKDAHKFYLNLGFSEIKEQKVFQMSL